MFNDLRQVPPELQPLSAWTYCWLRVLYSLPLVGWIFLVCHAVGSQNLNKRSFARSFFCVYVIVIILVVVLALSGATSFWPAAAGRA